MTPKRRAAPYEARRALSDERLRHARQLSVSMTARLAEGARVTFDAYRQAQQVIGRCRRALDEIFTRYDVLVTPSVPDEAPEGLSNIGDSTFIRIWTACHTPTVNLPVFRGQKGLPMGMQVIGPVGADLKTLACAEWIFQALTG